ncbi:MAG: hypothetical protein JO157_05915 [Acetobacteraceae bacterium]|nr:hypothetical protein [Acetobacteraceae bacterium]
MNARKQGPCAACSDPIEPGQKIIYPYAGGAKHLSCPAEERASAAAFRARRAAANDFIRRTCLARGIPVPEVRA